jgi:hypothetical protein
LRGYGNALCAPVAEEFIRAYMELQRERVPPMALAAI